MEMGLLNELIYTVKIMTTGLQDDDDVTSENLHRCPR